MIAGERGNKATGRPIQIIDTMSGAIVDFDQPHRWCAHALSRQEGSHGPTAATNAAVLFCGANGRADVNGIRRCPLRIKYSVVKIRVLLFRQTGEGMNPQVILPDSNQITTFCRNNDILKLAVYGSALRNDFGPDSDIDLLVKFRPGARIGLFRVVGLEKALSSFFGQRKIDLRTMYNSAFGISFEWTAILHKSPIFLVRLDS